MLARMWADRWREHSYFRVRVAYASIKRIVAEFAAPKNSLRANGAAETPP
jgi:hypothetical protein